uniref:EB domain-containing protein n=1 Tax=Wuchereria bancrofti TaxID=6293 RepID=A0A1I8EN16_WUCBA
MLCCSLIKNRLPYNCPSSKQIPAISGNNNMYCIKPGQTYVCPAGAICRTAANSLNVHICCYENQKVTQTVASKPECQNGAIAQSGISNSFVPCNQNGNRSDSCSKGYICLQTTNNRNQNLCCPIQTTLQAIQSICPEQKKLLMRDNGTLYYCFPTQSTSTSCPTNYTCNKVVIDKFDIYVCCRDLSSIITHCPSDSMLTLSENDEKIYCVPNNPLTCSTDVVCVKSVSSIDVYLCCYNLLSNRVCPDDQVPFEFANGQVEVCVGAGASCSQNGYTCQVSRELSTWICCGHPTKMALCADGRETFYQIEGQTYACNPLSYLNNCPVNYECAKSNHPNISVCCLTSTTTSKITNFKSTLSIWTKKKMKSTMRTTATTITTTTTTITTISTKTIKPECPTFWHPYENYQTGDKQFCNGIADTSCPFGYSCTHSTYHRTYICCRFGGGIGCASGTNILLVNNRPRLCTNSNNHICPLGYSCQLTTLANFYICCGNIHTEDKQTIIPLSFGSDIRCQHDLSIPALISYQFIRFCSTLGNSNGCPKGSLAIKVNSVEAVCGKNGFPYHKDGKPLECSEDVEDNCPEHYMCQPSFTNTKMYCCFTELHCSSSGITPNSIKYCEHLTDCQLNEECEEVINMNGRIHICCPKAIQEVTRCLGRETFLNDAIPVSCSSIAICPDDYECSNLTTTNDYTCCKEKKKLMQICPDNRIPYRRFTDDEFLYCDNNNFICPKGYLCKQSLLNDRFICCSPIGFCPKGRKAQLDSATNQAKRDSAKETIVNLLIKKGRNRKKKNSQKVEKKQFQAHPVSRISITIRRTMMIVSKVLPVNNQP